MPDVAVEVREDPVQVGVDPGDRRPRQVAVLAVRRAPAREVDPPVRARRDRVELAGGVRAHDDGEGRLGPRVGLALGLAARAGDAVAREQLDVGGAERLAAPDDLGGVRVLLC
ncbi:MAG TPA: hypothetical protein VGH76_08060 [Actinomycetospora sp.]